MSLLQSIERHLPDGYTLQDRLGAGATSWVYLAVGNGPDERLVVKVLHPGKAQRGTIDRFLREIAVLRSLTHPRIVPILEPGEAEGALFFTMPFLGRETLRMRLVERGALPVAEALAVCCDVAEALGYAHRHGVVHRDVKPENVLLTPTGAHLMDFGFADAPGIMSDGQRSGDAQLVIGTPAYISPEQVAGKRADDWRGDFYSLGVVLYEMLTGEVPFTSGAARTTMQLRLDRAAPDIRLLNPALPDHVAAIVRRCLERSPNDRYATAMHLRMALESALERECDEASERGMEREPSSRGAPAA